MVILECQDFIKYIVNCSKPAGHSPAVSVSQIVLLQSFFKTRFPLSCKINLLARVSFAFQIVSDVHRLKPFKSKYNEPPLDNLQMGVKPQVRSRPVFLEARRYFPLLDVRYSPIFKIPFRLHISFWQLSKNIFKYE